MHESRARVSGMFNCLENDLDSNTLHPRGRTDGRTDRFLNFVFNLRLFKDLGAKSNGSIVNYVMWTFE